LRRDVTSEAVEVLSSQFFTGSCSQPSRPPVSPGRASGHSSYSRYPSALSPRRTLPLETMSAGGEAEGQESSFSSAAAAATHPPLPGHRRPLDLQFAEPELPPPPQPSSGDAASGGGGGEDEGGQPSEQQEEQEEEPPPLPKRPKVDNEEEGGEAADEEREGSAEVGGGSSASAAADAEQPSPHEETA
jgi:hypothetical protein